MDIKIVVVFGGNHWECPGRGHTIGDLQKVFTHLRMESKVRGLGYSLGGTGTITLSADEDQITDEVIESVHKTVEAAFASL